MTKTWCEMSKATLEQGVAESSAKPESAESLWLPEAAHADRLFGWDVRISDDLPLGMIRFFRQKGAHTNFASFYLVTLRAAAAEGLLITLIENALAECSCGRALPDGLSGCFVCEPPPLPEGAIDPQKGARIAGIEGNGQPEPQGVITLADLQALNRAIRGTYGIREDLSARPLSSLLSPRPLSRAEAGPPPAAPWRPGEIPTKQEEDESDRAEQAWIDSQMER